MSNELGAVLTYKENPNLAGTPKQVDRFASLYGSPAWATAVVADTIQDGVICYFVAEGAPIAICLPHDVAKSLIAQVVQKL